MAERALNFGFSSCPNDTFAFHAMVHGLVPAPGIVPYIDDVEALNARAESGEAEVTKISLAAYGLIRERYALLRAGGAAGYGVGPIVVGRTAGPVAGRVAIPGVRTTAALLLNLLGTFTTVPMRFDRIEDAVLRGEVDCGVLIHEGRFTYQAKGLTLLTDLGAIWEERMKCALPLGAIAIRRDLAGTYGAAFDRSLRSSVEYAFAHPDASKDYVASLAQEMDPSVMADHIRLYVNDYTLALDQRAVLTLLEFGQDHGINAAGSASLPVFI